MVINRILSLQSFGELCSSTMHHPVGKSCGPRSHGSYQGLILGEVMGKTHGVSCKPTLISPSLLLNFLTFTGQLVNPNLPGRSLHQGKPNYWVKTGQHYIFVLKIRNQPLVSRFFQWTTSFDDFGN